MLTITTFIVDRDGVFEYVSHRSTKSVSKFNTTFDLTAWIGHSIRVVNQAGENLFTGTVVAKAVMIWDLTKPMGMRLISSKQTHNFEKHFHMACEQHNLSLQKVKAC